MALKFEGGTLIALGNLMATVWIEKDMEGQFVMVNARAVWDAATGTKRFRARDALADLAKQERWDEVRTILDATVARAQKGYPESTGSTGMTEGEAYAELTEALRRQGLDIDQSGSLVSAGFGEVAAKEEIGHFEALLRKMNFDTTRNHFRQAMSALRREEWESANANTRAFLDSLCEEVAARLVGFKADPPKGGEASKYLQASKFLSDEGAELLRAFFKVLHGGGSHPGTSGKNDATRRLLMASATGSYYIERLIAREEDERRDLFWMKAIAEEVVGKVGTSSMLSEYQSIDFDTIDIEDEMVVVETEDSYGHPKPLGEAWFTEFEEALERGVMEFAVVLTDRPLDGAVDDVKQVSDGVMMRHSTIAVVQVSRDSDRDVMRRRVEDAVEALRSSIATKRKFEREMEAQGKRPVRVGKQVMYLSFTRADEA